MHWLAYRRRHRRFSPSASVVAQKVVKVIARDPGRGSCLADCRADVVSVARQPEVFVHDLLIEPGQAQRLAKITRSMRDRVRLRRAGVVLASVQSRSAGETAMMFAASENYAREVIHAFNAQGFAALGPKWSGGRPAKSASHVATFRSFFQQVTAAPSWRNARKCSAFPS
jgi:hypothetical protein